MTDPGDVGPDPEMRARIERLQNRGSTRRASGASFATTAAVAEPSVARRRRPRPALGSRIASVGVGASTMLGIMTVLGSSNALSGAAEMDEQPAVPQPLVVVVHQGSDGAPNASASESASTTTMAPILLSANPVVHVIEPRGVPSSKQSAGAEAASAPATTAAPTVAPAPAPTVAPVPTPAPTTTAVTSGSA